MSCVFAHGHDELRALIDPVSDQIPENLLFPPFKKGGSPEERANHQRGQSQQYQSDPQQFDFYQEYYEEQQPEYIYDEQEYYSQ